MQLDQAQRHSLRGGPEAAALARRAVDAAVPDSARQDLRLLVTEIVGNAVRHGGMSRRTSVELLIDVEPEQRIRIEVRDTGPGFRPRVGPGRHEGGGWGLFILDQVADRWGVEGRDGALVWFELDL